MRPDSTGSPCADAREALRQVEDRFPDVEWEAPEQEALTGRLRVDPDPERGRRSCELIHLRRLVSQPFEWEAMTGTCSVVAWAHSPADAVFALAEKAVDTCQRRQAAWGRLIG